MNQEGLSTMELELVISDDLEVAWEWALALKQSVKGRSSAAWMRISLDI